MINTQPNQIRFSFKSDKGMLIVCYTDTGEMQHASGGRMPIYDVAVFLGSYGDKRGRYWGFVNKTSAAKYAKKYLEETKQRATP